MTKITYIPGEIANAAIDEHGNRKPVTRTHHIFDDAKGKSQAEVNADVDDSLAFHQSEINALNNQNYVTVDSFSSLPATGAVDTVYRVSNWDGTQQDPSVYSEYAWNGEDYVHLSTKTQIGEVFDISAYHATGGTLATYADLSAALDSNNGGGVPQSLQKGGMSIKFVQSSDNNYVQFRCIARNFTTDVTKWQGVDAELTYGSKNLIESGAVEYALNKQTIVTGEGNSEINYTLEIGRKYVFINKGNVVSSVIIGVNSESELTNIGNVPVGGSLTYYADRTTGYIKMYSGTSKTIIIDPQLGFDARINKNAQDIIAAIKQGHIQFGFNIPATRARIRFPMVAGEKYKVTNPTAYDFSFISYNESGNQIESFGTIGAKKTKEITVGTSANIIGGYSAASLWNVKLQLIDESYKDYATEDTKRMFSVGAPIDKNIISLLNITKGSYDSSGYSDTEIAIRCKTDDINTLPFDSQLNVGTHTANVTEYTGIGFASGSALVEGFNKLTFIPKNTPFRFIIRDDSADSFTLAELLTGSKLYRADLNDNDYFSGSHYKAERFERGGIANGMDRDYDTDRRIRSLLVQKHDVDVILKSNNYRFAVAYFSDNYEYVSATSWEQSVTIQAGTKYRIVIADISSDTTPKTTSQLINDVTVTIIPNEDGISELPYYYNSYIEEKVATLVKDVIIKKDGNGDSFIFITDTHFQEEDNNAGQSGRLIDYLAGRTSIDKIIHGGDVSMATREEGLIGFDGILKSIEWSREKLFRYTEKYDFLNVHGNHDYNNLAGSTGDAMVGIEIPTVRNYIFNSITLPFTADDTYENGMYYFYDNPISKIRYIVVDTEQNQKNGTASMDNYYQLAWVHRTVQSLPTGYDIVIVSHMPIEVTVATTNEYTTFANLLTYIKAINNHRSGTVGGVTYDFTNATFRVIMVISGHNHVDSQTFVDNVFHVTTKCDKIGNSVSPFDPVIARERGTTHEQAFDAVTIYNDHQDIQFRRIGDGYDRLFHTEKIQMSVGKTKDFSSLIEIVAASWVTNDSVGNSYGNPWTLSNTILSVDSDGVVTALSTGDAFMFAKDANGNKEFFYISVE